MTSEMQEVPPVRVAHVAQHGGNRERFRRGGLAHEAQAGFVREPVGFEEIYLLLGPHQILERIAAAAITRNDVVQI